MVRGPAAGRVVPLLPGCRVSEQAAEQQVGERQVVVGEDAGTSPAAVLEKDALI